MTSSHKVALIGGYGKGSDFGESLIQALMAADYKVAVFLRNPDKVDLPDEVGIFVTDLTDEERVADQVARVEAEMGAIEVYVHNASGLVVGGISELSPGHFEAAWRGSVLSAVTLCHALVPYMLKRSRGTVIFTGATAALRGGAKFAAFASAKFALRGLSQSMARELGPKGIHVAHVIVDGLISGFRAQQKFDAPIERCIDADDMAGAYLDLIRQSPSCWTQELDIRPSVEQV